MRFNELTIDIVAFGLVGILLLSLVRLFRLLKEGDALLLSPSVMVGSCAVLLIAAPQGFGLLISDSAEYFGVASHLLFEGRADLPLNGADLPSRYLPWFSWFFLYPVLRLGGDERALIGVICAFSLLGIGSATVIARSLLPRGASAVAPWVASALLLIPTYRFFSTQLMTDVPVAALMLLCAAVYSSAPVGSTGKRYSLLDLAALGAISAIAVALRPLAVFVLIPFLWEQRTVKTWVVLLAPTLVLVAVSGWFNYSVFGSPLRSGYHFWMAVPYDYPWLVFSIDALLKNGVSLMHESFFLPVLVTAFLPRRIFGERGINEVAQSRVRFFILGAVAPESLIHLTYFYPSIRFFLPLEALCGVVAFARLATLVSERRVRWFMMLCFVALAIVSFVVPQRAESKRLQDALQRTALCAPSNALIVSALHPSLVHERVIRGTERTLLPLSRKVEFASKFISYKPIPPPNEGIGDPFAHRSPWLRDGGAAEAFAVVALEALPEMMNTILQGGSVILIDVGVTSEERAQLAERFELRSRCPGVVELLLK